MKAEYEIYQKAYPLKESYFEKVGEYPIAKPQSSLAVELKNEGIEKPFIIRLSDTGQIWYHE